MHDLPTFAKQWAQQWKAAAPALQAIRDQELRQLDGLAPAEGYPAEIASHRLYDRYPERHGMVVMQKWLMRKAWLDRQAEQSP